MKKCISALICALICGVALLSVSCVKEENRIGKEIRFSAVSESQSGVETRTEYSNDIVTANSADFERINWISGDDMYIRYNSTYAVYNVSTISSPAGNKKSTATVTPASSSALEWGTGPHTFYAVYPATVPSGETAPTVNGSGVVSGFSIPATQTVVYNSAQGKYLPDMRKAYMVSYLRQNETSESVNLPFTPAVTALEFKLKLKDNQTCQDVASVQLKSSSHVLSGAYTVNITGFANDAVTWTATPSSSFDSGTNNYITVNFKNSSNTDVEPALSNSNELNFTIFVVPNKASNGAAVVSGLSLLIKYHDGEVRELGMSGLSLVGGNKYLISNSKVPSYNGYTYHLTLKENNTVINNNTVFSLTAGDGGGTKTISIQSYKVDDNDANNVKAVPWKMQYSTDGSNWTDLPEGGYDPAGGNEKFTASARTGNGASLVNNALSSESSTLTLPSTTPRTYISSSGLDAVTSKGDPSNPYDLSTNGSTTNMSTANCYIVTGPGVYKIPCVYGNSIKNGAVNTSASWFTGATDSVTDTNTSVTELKDIQTNYLYPNNPDVCWAISLYNARNRYVTYSSTDPNASNYQKYFVIRDLSPSTYQAIVLWQDVPQGQEIIPYENGYVSCDGTWVTFKIDSDRIKPGNIVIAVKGTATDLTNEIFWSWHIWIPEAAVGTSGSFMDRNLGEVTQTQVTKSSNRSLKFRVVQTETGGTTSNAFTFSQNGTESSTPLTTRNTYYQWGRKDPMLNTNSNSVVSVNPSYRDRQSRFFTAFQGFTFAGAADYGKGIRAPWMLLQNSKTKVWIDGDVYPFKASRTEVYSDYYIYPGHEVYGPFTAFFTNWFDTYSDFNSAGGWERHDDTWHMSSAGYNLVWTNFEAWYLANDMGSAPAFELYTDLIQVPGSGWHFASSVTITQEQLNRIYAMTSESDPYYGQGVKITNAHYTTFLGSLSKVDEWYMKLNSGETYPYGPHNATTRQVFSNSGLFDVDSDLYQNVIGYTYTDWPSGSGVGSGAYNRTISSIVYNLWNAYTYAENPNGDTYTNKFKTIYDPCPVGYTVPTLKVGNNQWSADNFPERGSLPTRSSTEDPDGYIYNIGNYTYNVNGYWTDRARGIKLIDQNGNQADIANYKDYDQAYMKIKGSGNTNTPKYRSVAASIRPMVDPK